MLNTFTYIYFFLVTYFNCSFFHRENGRDANFPNDKSIPISVLARLYPEIYPLFCNDLRICLEYPRVLIYFMDLKIKLGILTFHYSVLLVSQESAAQ